MQAKIIDFANEKILKQLKKIEENDHEFLSLNSKFRLKKKRKKKEKVRRENSDSTSNGDMVNGEYSFPQNENDKKSEEQLLIEENEFSSVDGNFQYAPESM